MNTTTMDRGASVGPSHHFAAYTTGWSSFLPYCRNLTIVRIFNFQRFCSVIAAGLLSAARSVNYWKVEATRGKQRESVIEDKPYEKIGALLRF